MKLENVMLSKRSSYMMLFYKISSIGLWGEKSGKSGVGSLLMDIEFLLGVIKHSK